MKCKYTNGGGFPTKNGNMQIPKHKGDGTMKHVVVGGIQYDECPECGWASNVKKTSDSQYQTVTFVHNRPYKPYGRDFWGIVVANGEEVALADRRLLHLMCLREDQYGLQKHQVKKEFVPALTDPELAEVVITERAICFAPKQYKRAIHAHQ